MICFQGRFLSYWLKFDELAYRKLSLSIYTSFMSSSPLNQLQKPAILLGGAIVAFVLFVTRQPVESEINSIWVTLVLILVFSSVVAIIKSLTFVLCTHVLFIDMPDPDNYAAALLRSHQSKMNDNLLARIGRKVLKSFGLSFCPLYIVCAGRRVNLGLAHKNAHGRFFDESAKCWLNWDPNEHIGQLAADKDITCDSKTIEDSFLVLKKNMFDLDCILHSAGFADYILVKGHIAKEIPLSYSHHADEWRFYNNVKKSWVSLAEYDQLSDRRCDESDDSQDFEQRRKLAHHIINKLTGASDFASSCFGSHWLSLDQFHTLLSKYSKIGLTVAGPATDMAYLVKKVSSWTGNVREISAMWAVCELGFNTGKMNVCGMNFNEAADLESAECLSPNYFSNATFSFLPTETCKLTPQFKVTQEMAEETRLLQCIKDKIALWTHVKGGKTEPLFDYFICESPDMMETLLKMGLIRVFVIPKMHEGYMILSPSECETKFTAWVNPSEMFRVFIQGKSKIYFDGNHWSSAKVVA